MQINNKSLLTQACHLKGGAAPGLAAVIAVGAISILLVTAFKLFKSIEGEVNLGPGIRFKWFIR